jgi:hypothetical protein
MFLSIFFVASPTFTGTSVFGNMNGTAGSSLSELSQPWGITVYRNDSMLITEYGNPRVLRVTDNMNSDVVASSIQPYLGYRKALFDDSLLRLFVIDSDSCLMIQYYNGSLNSTIVFGSKCGANLTQFQDAASFYMDSQYNFYIADNKNHRIMSWKVNSTSGTVLAGETGVADSDLQHLYYPQDIALDETKGLM